MNDKDQGAFKLRKATILSAKSYIPSENDNILDLIDKNSLQGNNFSYYENPDVVVDLI